MKMKWGTEGILGHPNPLILTIYKVPGTSKQGFFEGDKMRVKVCFFW